MRNIMGDKKEEDPDPFGFIIKDCGCSTSQEDLLTQIPFAREHQIFPEDEKKTLKEYRDGTTYTHGSKSSANLGFGGERKLEGNCEQQEEEKVKKQEKEEDEVVVGDSGKKKVRCSAEEESESEKKKRQKKRELPRSIYELVGWDEGGLIGSLRDVKSKAKPPTPKQLQQHLNRKADGIGSSSGGNVKRASVEAKGDLSAEAKAESKSKGNVETTTTTTGGVTKPSVVVDPKSKCKGKAKESEDETNKCILDALKLLVTRNGHDDDDGDDDDGKIDIFYTANQRGILFPTSRFLTH